MFPLTQKPDMGARLYESLIDLATDPGRGTDFMKMLQYLAGVLVETCLIFDQPDIALQSSLKKLSLLLDCPLRRLPVLAGVLPPAHVIDFETERGRAAARNFFEEWMDCAFDFHALLLVVFHNVIAGWDADGQPKDDTLRLLMECAQRCLAFELAAQELCDVVIEEKVASAGWSLGDCIAALSAVAGRRVALSLNAESCAVFRGAAVPDDLDQVVHVMTQEAVRLGVPPGSDWRFGLAANDMPVNAPHDLIDGIEPRCREFFRLIHMSNLYDQAVSCAKAAGRMLAVASGGEVPEMEPAIAKPLAMAAITETYKSVCMMQQIASC